MTWEIGLLLGIIAVAVVLFSLERISPDVIGLGLVVLALVLAVAACTSSSKEQPPAKGPGEMELAENTGGNCDAESPWCGYDLMFDGTTLVVTSRSTPRWTRPASSCPSCRWIGPPTT